MSKIKIVGHASGSGVLTIAAPNTNTDRTITIPDVTGTLLDSGSDLPAANLTGTIVSARLPAANQTAKLPLSGGTMTGHAVFNNDVELRLGANADLKLWSDGTNSHIREIHGSGNLKIRADNLQLMNSAASASYLETNSSTGVITLYHGTNSPKLATASGGVTITGDVYLSNAASFRSGGEELLNRTDPVIQLGSGDGEDYLKFRAGAAERLRIATAGQIGIGGANYGNDGQVLTSTGASSAPAWENVAGTLDALTDFTVSSSKPTASSNPSAVGHLWIEEDTGNVYVCTSATTNQNNWIHVGGGSGDIKYFPALAALMIIGGGGGGGSDLRGGAGSGGMLYFTGFKGTLVYGTQYSITVGAGGTSPNSSNDGTSGGNSTAFGETAGGGNGGGTGGGSGANGGGDSGTAAIATSNSNYTTGTGYSGDGANNAGNPGPGGGGAGGDGEYIGAGNKAGGYGGVGVQIANIYNGSDNYYWAGGGAGPGYGAEYNGGVGGLGGGGGGGTYAGSGSGNGGAGGGSALDSGDAGTDQNNSSNGGDGGTNTGGGGGSSSHRGASMTSTTGGPGGSGIVCIKQVDSESAATTTGTVVKTTTGGYRYYAFLSSGTITFNE